MLVYSLMFNGEQSNCASTICLYSSQSADYLLFKQQTSRILSMRLVTINVNLVFSSTKWRRFEHQFPNR